MARITVEDCLEKVPDRFALVILAYRRAKALLGGARPLIGNVDNKEVVMALREIAEGKVRFMTEEEQKSVLSTVQTESLQPTKSQLDDLERLFSDPTIFG
jgi:DNA-directed RNA polymerase subunit omega